MVSNLCIWRNPVQAVLNDLAVHSVREPRECSSTCLRKECGYTYSSLSQSEVSVRRLLLAVLIASTCACVAQAATDTPRKIGADELIQIVAAAQDTPDAELEKKLTNVVLADQLSSARLAKLMNRLPRERSCMALMLLADQSMFLPPPADAMSVDAAPNAAAMRQMLVKIVNYVNPAVRQLPNLMATRLTNGFEDRPREDRLTSTGIESLESLPLHWVGSLKMEVTYRDRQEVEDKSVKAEKKGNGIGGLITNGEFGPVLSTVLADALKATSHGLAGRKAAMERWPFSIIRYQSTVRITMCSSAVKWMAMTPMAWRR